MKSLLYQYHFEVLRKKMELFFESEGLSKDEISIRDDMSRLEYNLRCINGMIANPKSIKGVNEENENDIIPLLLERKRLIFDRINELSSSKKIDSIQELIANIQDKSIKVKLKEELDSLQKEALKYKEDVQDITARETEAQIRLEQQRLDGLERKSKIWLSFLQRESAASIVGAVVLLLLTFSLIVGMVFGWESQVLSNGFLVILGYFFGQSSSKNNKDNDAGGACG